MVVQERDLSLNDKQDVMGYILWVYNVSPVFLVFDCSHVDFRSTSDTSVYFIDNYNLVVFAVKVACSCYHVGSALSILTRYIDFLPSYNKS